MYNENGFVEIDGEKYPVVITDDADIIVDCTPKPKEDEKETND